MAPKIERVAGTVFGPSAIQRKDSADHEQNPQRQKKEQEERDDEAKEKRPADRESVLKAVNDLTGSEHFTANGLSAQIQEKEGVLSVNLLQNNGTLVKSMSAEEFLRLRDSSNGDKKPRGKILDQKF